MSLFSWVLATQKSSQGETSAANSEVNLLLTNFMQEGWGTGYACLCTSSLNNDIKLDFIKNSKNGDGIQF